MARELLLLRHGKAKRGATLSDIERALRNRGKRASRRIGDWIVEHGVSPDAVVTSPATRALDTARRAITAAGLTSDILKVDGRIYDATVKTLIAVLADCHGRRAMLVGHNPSLEGLLTHLTGRYEHLRPGMLARIRLPDDWRQLRRKCGHLVDLVDPMEDEDAAQ